jgi:alpha-tubulin suppressor-like RCC1 family protein
MMRIYAYSSRIQCCLSRQVQTAVAAATSKQSSLRKYAASVSSSTRILKNAASTTTISETYICHVQRPMHQRRSKSTAVNQQSDKGVTRQRRVVSWGDNSFGTLGIEDCPLDRVVSDPTPINSLDGEQVQSIAHRFGQAAAVTRDGTPLVWGWKHHARSWSQAMVLKQKLPAALKIVRRLPVVSKVYQRTWQVPTAIPIPEDLAHDDQFVKCSISAECVAFITRQGKLYTMGGNYHGVLGIGDQFGDSIVREPTRVTIPKGDAVVDVKFGFNHMLVLGASGSVYSCGKGQEGSLGLMEAVNATNRFRRVFTPICIQSSMQREKKPNVLPSISRIAAGINFSVFVSSDGRVWTCGRNLNGELGVQDSFENEFLPHRISLPSDARVLEIDSGSHHTVALTSQNKVLTWGITNEGQTGRAASDAFVNPVMKVRSDQRKTLLMEPGEVDLSDVLKGEKIVSVHAGREHSACITESGRLIIWGGSDGTPRVVGIPGAIDIQFGWSSTIALISGS